MAYSEEFIQKTIDLCQPYTKDKLTEEDAREIADNLINFFELLIKLDKKYGLCGEESQKTSH